MFENRRLNRLFEDGEYQLPNSMRDSIADAAHWIAPLVTFLGSVLVAVLCIWFMENWEGGHPFIRALVAAIGITQFIFVGILSLMMFMTRAAGPPEDWCYLEVSCMLLGLALDELARKPLAAQTLLCEQLLKELAGRVVLAEQEHPGQEYHEDRLEAKRNFEEAFACFQRVGWISGNARYGKFFRQ